MAKTTGILRLAVALATSAVAACATTSNPMLPPEQVNDEKGEYVIGVGDQLQVSVWKNPELSVTVPVRPDGKISAPLVDDVHAEGLTTIELKELLTRELGEFVANPDVTIVVLSVSSKKAHIIGGVGRSGPLPLSTDMTIVEAISASGGFTTFADKNDIKLIRRTPEGDFEYRFDYEAYIKGRAPGSNIRLEPGDTIVVPD